ncbi:MAG: hypothetical protein ACTHOD_01790 [Motilibacteraceae bacterium]
MTLDVARAHIHDLQREADQHRLARAERRRSRVRALLTRAGR